MVAASDDGGKTFTEPVDVSDERGGDYPSLAVTSDGTVHAVFWTRDFLPPDEQKPEGEPAPVSPIQYVRSTDRGQSWSEPVPIDPGNQDAQRPPLLAADPGSGALYMVWYSHAEPMNDTEEFEAPRAPKARLQRLPSRPLAHLGLLLCQPLQCSAPRLLLTVLSVKSPGVGRGLKNAHEGTGRVGQHGDASGASRGTHTRASHRRDGGLLRRGRHGCRRRPRSPGGLRDSRSRRCTGCR